MSLRRLLPPALVGATLAGCVNLDLTDPNEPSSDTFWQTPAQAVAGVNAAYNALENNGTYGRWLVFATDLRSDIGMILSPWTDLSAGRWRTRASGDRKSTRLNSSHDQISYAVFCLKKKKYKKSNSSD